MVTATTVLLVLGLIDTDTQETAWHGMWDWPMTAINSSISGKTKEDNKVEFQEVD